MFDKYRGLIRRLLTIDDTPHSIALGTAIGLFIAWTPTVGIHMILVVGLALWLRANKLAAFIAVYVSNPFTMLPMYWIDYKLGAVVLDMHVTKDEFAKIFEYHGLSGWLAAFIRVCIDLAGPMWLGGIVLAIASAVPGYYVTRWAVERTRSRQKNSAATTATNDSPTAKPDAAAASNEPCSESDPATSALATSTTPS